MVEDVSKHFLYFAHSFQHRRTAANKFRSELFYSFSCYDIVRNESNVTVLIGLQPCLVTVSSVSVAAVSEPQFLIYELMKTEAVNFHYGLSYIIPNSKGLG